MEVLYGVPPACVYLNINYNSSDKSMKLTYFYATIDIAPRDSYNETLQCGTDRSDNSKLQFTYPYGNITPKQAAAVSEFTKTLTNAYNKLQRQIDAVNKDLGLEQYAPKTESESESDSECSVESDGEE